MKRKNLMLTVAAAAVLGAFNPAFAGGGAKHGAADSSYPSTEQSASGSGASRSDDMNVRGGVSVDRETGDTQPSAQSSGAEPSSSGNAQSGSSDITLGANVGAQAGASADRGTDPDKLTGLDRAHPAN